MGNFFKPKMVSEVKGRRGDKRSKLLKESRFGLKEKTNESERI